MRILNDLCLSEVCICDVKYDDVGIVIIVGLSMSRSPCYV